MGQSNVELSDILAVRLECRSCHAALSLPLPGKIGIDKLKVCPYCKEPWTVDVSGQGIESQVNDVIHSIQVLQSRMKLDQPLPIPQPGEEKAFRGGFTVALVVKSKD